jgi:hypothetical protein
MEFGVAGGYGGWLEGMEGGGIPTWSQSSPPHLRAALEEDPYRRIKLVLRWYLSGFYKKPKVRGSGGKEAAARACSQP